MKKFLILILLVSISAYAKSYKSGKYKLRGSFSFDKRVATMTINQGTSSTKVIKIEDFPNDKALLANKRNIEVITSVDKNDVFRFEKFVQYLPFEKTLGKLPQDKLPASIEFIK